jgi:hypothetical protein
VAAILRCGLRRTALNHVKESGRVGECESERFPSGIHQQRGATFRQLSRAASQAGCQMTCRALMAMDRRTDVSSERKRTAFDYRYGTMDGNGGREATLGGRPPSSSSCLREYLPARSAAMCIITQQNPPVVRVEFAHDNGRLAISLQRARCEFQWIRC